MAVVIGYAIGANPKLRIQADASPEKRQRLRSMFLDLNPAGHDDTIRTLIKETFPMDSPILDIPI